MQVITPSTLNDWKISYNPYTDLFQIFNEKVFQASDGDLKSTKKGFAVLVYEKNTNAPLMIEFTHVYDYIGDVDNMSKIDIIHKVIGYVKNYG